MKARGVTFSCKLPSEEMSDVYILAVGGSVEMAANAPSIILECISDLEVVLWEMTTKSWEMAGRTNKHQRLFTFLVFY